MDETYCLKTGCPVVDFKLFKIVKKGKNELLKTIEVDFIL